eukprot:1178133-Prorocentrum_minimum.AAC.4
MAGASATASRVSLVDDAAPFRPMPACHRRRDNAQELLTLPPGERKSVQTVGSELSATHHHMPWETCHPLAPRQESPRTLRL